MTLTHRATGTPLTYAAGAAPYDSGEGYRYYDVPLPASAAAGDLLTIRVGQNLNISLVSRGWYSTPDGIDPIAEWANDTIIQTRYSWVSFFAKAATATDISNGYLRFYPGGGATNNPQVCIVCDAWTGDFDPDDPIKQISNTEYVVGDYECRAAGLTVSGTDRDLLFFGYVYYLAGVTFSDPAVPDTWTAIDTSGDDTSDAWLTLKYLSWSGSGDTGTVASTMSVVRENKCGMMFEINPAPITLTSTKSGNASDPTVWGGTAYASGYNLKRRAGDTVTFDETTPALGNVSVDATGTDTGGFILASDITFTAKIVDSQSPGKFEVNEGVTIDLTSINSDNGLSMALGWWQTATRLILNGTLAKPIIIKCSGGTPGAIAPALGQSLKIEGTGYCKFQNIAGCSFDRGAYLTGPIVFDSACDGVDFTAIDGDDFLLTGLTHYGDLDDYPYGLTFSGSAPQTGLRSLNDIFVPNGTIGWFSEAVWTCVGGAAESHSYTLDYQGTFKNWVTIAENWMPWVSKNEIGLVYALSSVENPHGCGYADGIGRDCQFYDMLLLHLRDTVTNPQYDLGDGVFIPDFAYKLDVKRCIELPNAGGEGSWRMVVGFGGASAKCTVDGCEVLSGHNVGETYAGIADMVTIKNQILRSTGSHCWFQNGNAVDYIIENASHGASIAGSSDPWNKVTYSGKYRLLSEANDITSDPQYVDGDRNVDTWAVSLGCTETTFEAKVLWALDRIEVSADPWHADHLEGATMAALSAYIREGRTPQNADYLNGAGGDFQTFIGPVEPVVQSSGGSNKRALFAIRRRRTLRPMN